MSAIFSMYFSCGRDWANYKKFLINSRTNVQIKNENRFKITEAMPKHVLNMNRPIENRQKG